MSIAITNSHTLRRPHTPLMLAALLTLLGVVMLIAIGTGALHIGPGQVIAILLKPFVSLPVTFDETQQAVVMGLRLPRVLMGALIGAALGASGATLQGLLRNALADAGLMGASSGAALFAVAYIVLGTGALSPIAGMMGLPLAAFIGSLCTATLVYVLAQREGQPALSTLLLAGIAVNALASALTGLLTFVSNDAQLRTINFWAMGSLGGATWHTLAALAPYCIVSVLGLSRLTKSLNAFQLGEIEAWHAGVNVSRLKIFAVALCALCVGASVAFAGVIGFVGLIVPNLLRMLRGPDHRLLVPGAALLGAALLVFADLISRTLIAPAELPLGLVTALMGAPFFMIILRTRTCSAPMP